MGKIIRMYNNDMKTKIAAVKKLKIVLALIEERFDPKLSKVGNRDNPAKIIINIAGSK